MASSAIQSSVTKFSNLQIPSSQVVLVYTEWNEPIIQELRKGALQILAEFEQITIEEIIVPGAIEIPFAIAQHAAVRKAHAYIALGCVIRGETPHFEYVCQSAVQGITALNLRLPSPVIFGILTVENNQQALDRLGGSQGHKGEEAAITALKMIAFKHSLQS